MYYILGIATGCTLAYFIGVKNDSVKGNLKEARGIFIATILVRLYLCITLERGSQETEESVRDYIRTERYDEGYGDGYDDALEDRAQYYYDLGCEEGYDKGYEWGLVCNDS